MSTPMYNTPEHFPMPIHDGGEGPEMNEALVVRTICWSCMPEEDWPCEAYRLESRWLSPEWGVEYRGVTVYESEAEARRQLNFAQMDVPASLVRRLGDGPWERVE